ncbi:MAG TPA: NapC/NirT family cytochrome c [Nitrospirales bacterium]|jgi:nitrate/TMAO reductase-like tetraheme cytochrome c subunit
MPVKIPRIAVIVITLAVLGVVAAAVAIPLTNDPKFCASCHTIKPSYQTWVVSTHKEVTCVACHVRPTFEGFVQDKVIKGTHDVWVTLIGHPKKPDDLKATVHSEVCLSCHANMLRISELATRDLPGPLKKAGLIMEHRKHMEAFKKRDKGEGCATCHATVVHGRPYKGYPIVVPRGHIKMDDLARAEKEALEASMVKAHRTSDCLQCHDGKQEYAGKVLSRKCATCHTEALSETLF